MTELATALFDDAHATSSQLAGPEAGEKTASPAALLASVFVIGTGGSFTSAAGFVGPARTGAAITITEVGTADDPYGDASLAPATQLAVVRRWLSLTIKDLADVLRVQRPTIYAWMAGRSTPHPDNVERLRRVYRLASAWRSMAKQPIGKLKHAGVERRAVVEALRAAEIDESALTATFTALARALPSHPTALSQITADAGIDVVPHGDFERSVDLETLG